MKKILSAVTLIMTLSVTTDCTRQTATPGNADTTQTGKADAGRSEAERLLSEFTQRELELIGLGQFEDWAGSFEKFRSLVADGIGDSWKKNPEPGQRARMSRTALIMSCRQYLKRAEYYAGRNERTRLAYDRAKAALDNASPYREDYLQ